MGERNGNERNEEQQDYNIREGNIIKKRESIMREILGKVKENLMRFWECERGLRIWERNENVRKAWEWIKLRKTGLGNKREQLKREKA